MEFLTAVAVSSVLGFLAGLGVGGGSLLILYLTLVLDWPPEDARAVNLLFFLPSAAIATCQRRKDGTVEIKKLVLPILLGCLGAAAASVLADQLDTGLIKKLFGSLLLGIGVKELLYKEKRPNAGKPPQ